MRHRLCLGLASLVTVAALRGQQPPPLSTAFPGAPALVDVVQVTSDTSPDTWPALGFADTGATGLLLFAEDVGWNTGSSCNHRHVMYSATFGAAGLGPASAVPTQAIARHGLYSIAFRPAATSAFVTLNTSIPNGANYCADDVASTVWSGGAFGPIARFDDGLDDDDLNGAVAYLSNGNHALVVWNDQPGSWPGSYDWTVRARLWDELTGTLGPNVTIEPGGVSPWRDMRVADGRGVAAIPGQSAWVVAYGGSSYTGAAATFDPFYRIVTLTGGTLTVGPQQALAAVNNGVEDGRPVIAFRGTNGVAVWSERVGGLDLEVMAAVWDPLSGAFGPAVQLTDDDAEDAICAGPSGANSSGNVIATDTGFHIVYERQEPGEPDRELAWLWFDGVLASHPVRLTDDGLDDEHVDAAIDGNGIVHLAWKQGPVSAAITAADEILVGRLAFPTVGTAINGGAFDASAKNAFANDLVAFGPAPGVHPTLAPSPLALIANFGATPVASGTTMLQGTVIPNLVALSLLSAPPGSEIVLGTSLGAVPMTFTAPAGMAGIQLRVQGLALWPAIGSLPVLATSDLRITFL
ncbi:MAG: hypothetical protein KDC98_10405 [Planctomycetes bacterium]|nr:hypothetical protein [Planctomycetota bacterium]